MLFCNLFFVFRKTAESRYLGAMENKHEDFWPILPIADTVSGTQARENPQDTIDHYQRLQTQLWLSPKVRDVADGMLSHVQQGRTAWGSLSGTTYRKFKRYFATVPL